MKPIEGTDTGWVRCTECARTAGGSSDDYWTKVSCNRNQCATIECCIRKLYARLAEKRIVINGQIRNMPAIKDKETGEQRKLTSEEKRESHN